MVTQHNLAWGLPSCILVNNWGLTLFPHFPFSAFCIRQDGVILEIICYLLILSSVVCFLPSKFANIISPTHHTLLTRNRWCEKIVMTDESSIPMCPVGRELEITEVIPFIHHTLSSCVGSSHRKIVVEYARTPCVYLSVKGLVEAASQNWKSMSVILNLINA